MAAETQYDARILDASRSGVRLRVPGQSLGVYRLAPLAFVSRQVARLLGVEFEVRLHPERLGMLVTKRFRPVRIGQRDARSADVELGCVLAEPFSDEEAVMLGLGLPKVQDDGLEAEARLASQAPQVREGAIGAPQGPTAPAAPRRAAPAAPVRSEAPPRQPSLVAPAVRLSAPAAPRPPAPTPIPTPAPAAPATAPPVLPRNMAPVDGWRAYVHPMGTKGAPPFVARAELISATGVQLKVLDRSMLGLSGPADVASTMTALGSTYGSEVALRIVDGATHLWTGPARIEMIEVGATAPHPVTIWLAYGRSLRPAELRALALV